MSISRIIFLFAFLLFSLQAITQNIILSKAKFTTENNDAFKLKDYDDTQWAVIKTGLNWELQGYDGYNGYGWYRIKTLFPSSLKTNSYWKDSLRINLGKIDDCDEVYLNGILISKSGSFPTDKDGYVTTWNATQEIHLATNNALIKWDAENTIAIKVYDGNGGGGMFGNEAYINILDLIDGIQTSTSIHKENSILFTIKNIFDKPIAGRYKITNGDESKKIELFTLKKNEQKEIEYTYKASNFSQKLIGQYIEYNTNKSKAEIVYTPYILTPKPSSKLKIHTPLEYGASANKSFLYKVPASGNGPINYSIKGMPQGLLINKSSGIISGTIITEGIYNTVITIKNKSENISKPFIIKVGEGIALTPPMGWNSWNCWGTSVSQAKVRASAKAMIENGLINYGWNYINIDDGWEAKQRNANGEITSNEKFPNMKGLGNWLHENGLKFGIYSSPGPLTCGGYLGSHTHELQDAITYNSWGIDYLKYDWCSYDYIHAGKDTSIESYKKPYLLMNEALQQQPRDIVYSLCQYGMKEVWKWGASVGGNVWRTTGDIEDSWESLKGIGFSQTKQQAYAKPGGWNDVDMMIIGQLGWGENLRPSRLTPDEQYTHVSLWCLLNNPLLIGCDMSKLDKFTLNLLTNEEVIGIDQNTYAEPAKQIIKTNEYEVWVKKMGLDKYAVGIFNFEEETKTISIDWTTLGMLNIQIVRDVWRQLEEGEFSKSYNTTVGRHGVKLILCSAK